MLPAILFDLEFLCADIDSCGSFLEPVVSKDDIVGVGLDGESVLTDGASCNHEWDCFDYSKCSGIISVSNSDSAALCGIDVPSEKETKIMANDGRGCSRVNYRLEGATVDSNLNIC